MTTPTNFSARTDGAALALKGQINAQNRQLAERRQIDPRAEIQPRSVPVGPNGQPAPPLPPEGSYARQAIERQRAQARERAGEQLQTQDDLSSQQGQHEQNGAAQGNQQPQDQNQLSPNAQRRFSELTTTLRQKDQELQQALARSKQLEETQAQTQARLSAIEARFQQVVNQNLDSLDPETRAQVMQQAAIDESAARIEQRVMQTMAPVIQRVTTQAIESELGAVAAKYPAFDAEVHGPLIEMFRQQNPRCTIEQAFRAIAEPEELAKGRSGRAPAVPPIAVPQTVSSAPRYVPTPPPQQKTPEQEVAEERDRAFRLAASSDPNDRRMAGRAMDAYIAKKLHGRLPGRR
jgi:DNA repair exonuclease SbcCD ATPase subunit